MKVIDDYEGQALITFSYDDGRRNNYEIALPLHEKYSIPMSMAIIAGRTIKPTHWKRHMEPWQVTIASQRGVEITSHSYNHTERLTDLEPEELSFELKESKNVLRGMLPSNEVSTICIPFSASNKSVLERAKEEYELVRIKGNKLNRVSADTQIVYSYGMTNITSLDSVKELVDKAVKRKRWIVLMLHGVVDKPEAEKKYDVTKVFLERLLEYISSFHKEQLLPVNFADVLEIKRQSRLKGSLFRTVTKSVAKPALRSAEKVLAEEPGYMITFHKGSESTSKLMISFGGLPSKKTKRGFGSNFFLKQGYDHIFVAQEAGSQYQHLSLERFAEVVSPYLDGYEVYTYGSSLGAYCAVYYGGVINAQIIAAAPKNSAHPSMRKKKFDDVPFLHQEISDVPRSKKQPIIIYDPHRNEESNFISNCVIPAYPEARQVTLPFAGHTVLNTLLHVGMLKEFITSIVERDEVIDVKLQEEGSYIWHAEKGRHYFLNEDFTNAQEHLEKSLSLKLTKESVRFMLKLCIKTENPKLGLQVVDKAKEEFGHVKFIHSSIISKLESLGESEKKRSMNFFKRAFVG